MLKNRTISRFTIFTLIIVLLFTLSGCVNNGVADNIFYPTNQVYTVNSINHRGYYTAPENTLSAYKESYENGFQMVECDVRFTKDGCPVLLHNDSIDETSNGSGKISQLMLEEVREFDFGSWKSDKYLGEKIPTFEEFIMLCRNLSLSPYVDIKYGTNQEQLCQLVNIAIKYGMKDKVTWISFEKDLLKIIVEEYDNARIGYCVNKIDESKVKNLLELRTDKNYVFFDCHYVSADSAAVELCISELIPLEVWVVDDKQELLDLNPYISGVTSDNLIAGKILAEGYLTTL